MCACTPLHLSGTEGRSMMKMFNFNEKMEECGKYNWVADTEAQSRVMKQALLSETHLKRIMSCTDTYIE